MKISTYDKPVKGMRTGGPGRKPSEETLALQAAIEASAKDGKARRWEGGAKPTFKKVQTEVDGKKVETEVRVDEYKKNGQRLRGIAHNHVTDLAPLGYSLSVGLEGEDLTFSAKPKVAKKPAEAEAEKPAEAEAKPTAPAKKAPAKKAPPQK